MDPMSRKLFRNSEARSRLAQMGGIMASSPALAGTVARFDDGGRVRRPRVVVRNGQPFAQMADGSLIPLSELGFSAADLAGAGTADLADPFVPPPSPAAGGNTGVGSARMQGLDPGISPPMMDFNVAADLTGRDTLPAMLRAPLRSELRGIEPPPTPAEAIGLDPMLPPPVAASRPAYAPADWEPDPAVGPPPDRGGQLPWIAPNRPLDPESLRLAAVNAERLGESELAEELRASADAQEAAAFDDIGEILPPPTQEPPVEDPTPAPGDPEQAQPGGTGDQDPLAEVGAQLEGDLRTFFGIERPSREPGSRRERVNQELELIREVFGDRTRDQARDRAMHLAMIGLAIAAGQSPNALTNIAQGALAGTQAMARAQQAQQEREDEMRMMAYRAVLSEDERAQNLADQMGLARFRASLGGEGGRFGTITHPLNQWFTARLQFDQQARDPSSDLWAQLREMPEAERSAYLDREAFDRVISGFGAMTPEVGDLRAALESGQLGRSFAATQGQGGVPGQVPVVTSREEYDNLPSGAEFIQNGQRRRKP